MTERTSTLSLRWAVSLVLSVAGFLGGCSHEDYYCDKTGCFYCDGVGCRNVPAAPHPSCRGDFECSAGQICTNLGCVAQCRTDRDCTQGWQCRGGSLGDAGSSTGLCVGPLESTPMAMPGVCRLNSDCPVGTVCLDGVCHTSTSSACTRDSECGTGRVCLSGRCATQSDVCQFDNQCGAGRVCVNSQCRTACGGAVSCPSGQMCTTSGSAMYCVPSTSSPGCVHDSDCAAGNRCLNGACYVSCSSGSSMCTQAGYYCGDEMVCVPDLRAHPFCDATRPCHQGSQCVGGICRVPCSTNLQCQMVEASYRNCGQIPYLATSSQNYCLTDHEYQPSCTRQSDCAMGQSCVDGTCS